MTTGNPLSRNLPIRQTDVARRAGVSTATVSRVLNGSGAVRADVRLRVEAAMADLGYIPHVGARSLATRRTRTLGAIIPTLNNAIFAAGVDSFEAEARRLGHSLVISVSNYDPGQEAQLIRQMIERQVDGLMLVGHDRPETARAMLAAADLPYLCAWTFDASAPGPDIGFDNRAAMVPIVDHLVAGGRRRIAMLSGLTPGNDRARDRLAGARARLDDHGLALAALIELRYSISEGRAALRDLLNHKPDAVICGNDVIAYGALSAARGAGLSVPSDIAVTGFDDLPLSADLNPALTSVAVPAAEMGRLAAAELIGARAEIRPVGSRRMETQLVIRASSR